MDQNYPLVITLWETYGSNMEAVAAALADRMGLDLHQQAYSSEEIEAAAAEREREGALGRLLRHFSATHFSHEGQVSAAARVLETNYMKMAEENTAVVQAEAAQGGVLMGRNGQYILRDRPHTLHVKLDGPKESRIAKAMEISGISRESAAKRQAIEDDFRSQLSVNTYHFDPRDNDYYDVVVNGADLPVAAVVAIIAAAAEAKTAPPA